MQNTLFALSLGFAGLILALHAAQATPAFSLPAFSFPAYNPEYPSQINFSDTSNSAQVTS